ncbi:MAG: glucosidase [Deltaproteobacteria bacterium]|nr:glucosidase [Deltaproteobacteria bacterium]
MRENRVGRSRWRRWGPYLAERAWGTVREDYSRTGDAWGHLTHEQAMSKAYRWGEDGIAGICDRDQHLCLALALWNGRDPFLKERLFGLTGMEGNHAEDVKEVYYYLDATPTNSYLRMLYKYPQAAFPYQRLRAENARRRSDPGEFELIDTGIFDDGRYFDVFVEYAKATADDIHCRITVHNRGPERAPLHVLPTLWFRNTWSWKAELPAVVPNIGRDGNRLVAMHEKLGTWNLYFGGAPQVLFTHNESNHRRLWDSPNRTPWTKDAFHDAVVHGRLDAVNPDAMGTKAALWYRLEVDAGASATVDVRLTNQVSTAAVNDTDAVVRERARDCRDFYDALEGPAMPEDARRIHRQACAGLLWSMQYYHYDVDTWLRGDRNDAPAERRTGRNAHWHHLDVADVISMPDKWEYPWFAAWDLAFHCVALAHIDVELAKAQLKLMVKEWYQHPSGQIPAYEWNFSDLNPPVHAWAAFQVYKFEARATGKRDRVFLERIFHKLLMNFAWWVNRKDSEGNNVFEGGFLGLDNISLFDRSERLPDGARLQQADATAWMAMYCLDLMRMALELAQENSAYEDLASKFFEHFLYIADAINHGTADTPALWDDKEGWYYDLLTTKNGDARYLRVASQVGLIPMFAVHVLEPEVFERLPNFSRRFFWFLERRPELARSLIRAPNGRTTLSLLNRERLARVLQRLLDEDRMLSPFGPRSLSKEHAREPYRFAGMSVGYEPAEAVSRIKGGNSNWRGPIWFPTSYLVIRALTRLQRCFGDEFTARCPARTGPELTCGEIAMDLSRRMVRIFQLAPDGTRPVYGSRRRLQDDPHFRDHLWFFEYFHGDTGEGLGASHQTGWTGLVADLVLRTHARDARTTLD